MSSQEKFYVMYNYVPASSSLITAYRASDVKVVKELSATSEEDALSEMQKYSLDEFTILKSIGTYRKSKPVVNYEKV